MPVMGHMQNLEPILTCIILLLAACIPTYHTSYLHARDKVLHTYNHGYVIRPYIPHRTRRYVVAIIPSKLEKSSLQL